MSQFPTFSFSAASLPKKGTAIVLCNNKVEWGETGKTLDKDGALSAAVKASGFEGGLAKSIEILAPSGTGLDRIVLMGLGDSDAPGENDCLKIGGTLFSKISAVEQATLVTDLADGADIGGAAIAQIAQGMMLNAYKFDKYKVATKSKPSHKPLKLSVAGKTAAAGKKQWANLSGVTDGVLLARDLVNEPANVLTPKEFAKRASALKKLGCKVEILDEKDMKALKMGALLGVAQGSRNAPRMAIIEWKGGKAKDKPIAFVGKGVTFDTGGISIKPAGGMEDMKGDMGGAAAVTGLMHALASRKAKAYVVGVIGLVENMPDGNAQRPGDVVKSMSGQTIEIINTDAEGRLVLADALWHCNKKFKPKFMVNLATLTGAILVALGKEHAGLFSNDDDLSNNLLAAGLATDEKLWRMPLSAAYDKLIDTKNADMKNSGGRLAGSVTAGQFLQRFVGKTPWAHLDVAGTAMGSPSSAINRSWASGYGVRLLNRLVEDNYEK